MRFSHVSSWSHSQGFSKEIQEGTQGKTLSEHLGF
jgi:hypothetical protein